MSIVTVRWPVGGQGDDLRLAERLVIAPVAGVFQPLPPAVVTTEGEIVREGQVLGYIVGPGRHVEITCFCSGLLMGMMAEPGERVRAGQPVAWLRVLGDDE